MNEETGSNAYKDVYAFDNRGPLMNLEPLRWGLKLMNIDVELDNNDSDGGGDGTACRKQRWGQPWGFIGSDFVLYAPLVGFQQSFTLTLMLKPAPLLLKGRFPKGHTGIAQTSPPPTPQPLVYKKDGPPMGSVLFREVIP